jgi:AraC-like DNA-binding protein
MRYVWDRRLTRCDREVTDPAMRGRRVRQIAFAADFNDLSHFSRAYRARYGCTPRDALAVRSAPRRSGIAAASRLARCCLWSGKRTNCDFFTHSPQLESPEWGMSTRSRG